MDKKNHINWDAFDHTSSVPQLMSCVCVCMCVARAHATHQGH